MADQTALDQLLRLRQQQEERESKLFQQAKQELLEEYSELRKKFTTLGISMPGASSGSTPRRESVRRQRDPNKPCPYCNVAGHDGRAHRSQKVKKAFTANELSMFNR